MFAKKNVKNIYALTPMQEAMLFQALYDSSSSAHFEQSFYHISGKLDVQIFEAAWNEIVRRHDILRTIFVHKDVPRPLQIVLKKRSINFNFEDISSLPKKEQDKYFEKQKEEDWLKPFVLSKDILMRVSLFKTGDRSFNVLWSFHHILIDGWSNSIIYNEFYQIYKDLSKGIKPGLKPTVPFALYIRWLKEQDNNAAELYWREYLSGYNQPIGLPRKIAEEQTAYHAKTFCFELDEKVTAALQKTASKNHVGFNTVIQTMWGILLGQYNDPNDSVFGAVVSGRPAEIQGIENMVGLLINLIPVRIQFDPLQSFKEIMLKVHDNSIKSKPFHHCSLASIQAETTLKQNLLDHVLVFENYPMEESATKTSNEKNEKNEKQDDTFIIDQFEHADHTNYDLNIQIAPGDKLH
ncbi:condensation domain-containing protein, partial [Desulfobacterales bacterium HSG16]|nr:condensation domain-containing protein [Desulfobacterales bacterium HSG16]